MDQGFTLSEEETSGPEEGYLPVSKVSLLFLVVLRTQRREQHRGISSFKSEAMNFESTGFHCNRKKKKDSLTTERGRKTLFPFWGVLNGLCVRGTLLSAGGKSNQRGDKRCVFGGVGEVHFEKKRVNLQGKRGGVL